MKGKTKSKKKKETPVVEETVIPKGECLDKARVVKILQDTIKEIEGKQKPLKAVYVAFTTFNLHKVVVFEGE